MASTKRILELLKTKSKIENKENAVVIENLNKNIRFSDVTFAYSNKKVFSNLNFEIILSKICVLTSVNNLTFSIK